jgi:hypothetical protein
LASEPIVECYAQIAIGQSSFNGPASPFFGREDIFPAQMAEKRGKLLSRDRSLSPWVIFIAEVMKHDTMRTCGEFAPAGASGTSFLEATHVDLSSALQDI